MKLFKWLIFASILAFLPACSASDDDLSASALINNPNTASEQNFSDKSVPILHFDHTEFDYGKVKAGTLVKHIYSFTNKGKAPLIITNAYGSCGCTVAEFPKNPVMPGKKGKIEVVFDTKGKNGREIKYVSIISNANPAIIELTLKGEITE